MPTTRSKNRETPADIWFWGGALTACLLTLGSGWILVTTAWHPAQTESVAQLIRAGLVCALSFLTFVFLLLHRRHRTPALREPSAAPWWTDPLAAATADAVLTFDDQLLIRSANEGAEELFGYSARELAGQSFFRVIPSSTRFAGAQTLAQTHNQKGIVLRVSGVHRDGSDRPVELRLTRFERGSRVMYLAVCRERRATALQMPDREEVPQADWTSRFMVLPDQLAVAARFNQHDLVTQMSNITLATRIWLVNPPLQQESEVLATLPLC